MSFFSSILEKLGLSKPAATPAATTASVAAPVKPATAAPVAKPAPAVTTPKSVDYVKDDTADIRPPVTAAAAAPAKPAPISEVDVVKKLEQMASGSQLNWKVSIVDLLKVLGIESSLEARKELAKELNCPEDVAKDNVKMNAWLHKEVLRQIAQNGGNIPQELLD